VTELYGAVRRVASIEGADGLVVSVGSSDCPAARDELKDQRDHGCQEQQVNQTGRDMERHEAKAPQHDQHNSESPEHGGILFFWSRRRFDGVSRAEARE
jgi:hypothetical protein